MSPSLPYPFERKPLSHFLSENIPNQIIYNCLKKNTDLADEAIRQAFTDAYGIGREVIASLDLHTQRSKNFLGMADKFSQASLLSHSIVYALLSFHKDVSKLGQYLANLRPVLERRFGDVFLPILMVTLSTAPILTDSVSFQPRGNTNSNSIGNLHNDETSIPIATIITEAKQLQKKEAITVLNLLKRIIANYKQDLQEIINLEIAQIEAQPDSQFRSKYKIADGHITDLCKLLKAILQARIIVSADGAYPTNQESFIQDVGFFFNTPIPNPSMLLSAAKRSKNYMDIFAFIYDLGNDYYTKDDGIPQKAHLPKSNEPTLF